MRSPDAAQRAALAACCVADPGSIFFDCDWVPALRRTAEEALHRVRDTQFYVPADAGRDAITTPASTSA